MIGRKPDTGREVGVPLSAIGLGQQLEQVYLAALELPQPGRAALAGRLELAAAAVEAAVAELCRLGLLREAGDRLEVVDPEGALSALVESVEDELTHRLRMAAATRREIWELAATYQRARDARDRQEHVERIEDLAVLRDRIAALAYATERELCAIQPGGPQSPEALEASRPLDRRTLQRGVRMRIIHEPEVVADAANRAYLVDIIGRGAEVRVTREPLDRLLIVDRRIAVVPIDPAHSRRGALILRSSGVVAGFIRIFEHEWAQATPLDHNAIAMSAVEMSELDRMLLRHLSSGDTDEATAARVGMSVRHLRRHIARLMGQLGARSRFEAGAMAARRGWI